MELKIAILIIMVSVTNVFATLSYSQVTRVSLDMKNATIEQVMDEIESQSEFYFVFNQKQIDVKRMVSIQVENKLITDILPELFNGTNVNYVIFDKKILLTIASGTEPQQLKISGTVRDEKGDPLPGVNVSIEGTTLGVITDIGGKYTLVKPNENAVLIFSFIGYNSLKESTSGKTNLDVTLVQTLSSIEEVVVIGYGTVLKKNITTSVSKVSVAEVSKASISNITQLLLGQASGLQATVASAQPGGNINISIRGGGNPIYVVDGIVMPNNSLEPDPGTSSTSFPSSVNRAGLAGLNPDDIESVEVLKDASASIYGIGASQGVVLITTKNSKEGPLKVSYDGSYSVVTNYKYVTPLNAQQYMDLTNIFSKERYLYTNNLAPYGPTTYTTGWSPLFTDADIANAQNTDWLNQVLRNGVISKHNLVLNGGSQFLKYYVSGNYFNQMGTVVNSNMDRYTLRANLIGQLASFIKLTTIINLNRNSYDNSTAGGASNVGIQGAGSLIDALRFPPNIPIFNTDGTYSGFKNVPNPVGLANIADLTKTNGVYANFAADFTIIKGMLSAKLLFGDNYEDARRDTYIPSNIYFNQMFLSRGNLGNNERENKTMEATITFNKEFGNIVGFDALVGLGKYINKSDGISVAYTSQYDAIANSNISTASGSIYPSSSLALDEKRSQFGRFNFDFFSRYIISISIRRDGTDKFFPGKKYALFPAYSVAWKLSNESFMKNISWINLLKFRASYGVTGSDNLGTILYGNYGPSNSYVSFSQNAVKYIPIISNGLNYPNVSWEKTTMKNIGLDFSLLKDRISGNFDVFQNDITNMLGNANSPLMSLFPTYPVNGGHLRREGWDANINTTNIKTSNFEWTSILNLSRFNELWIERLPNYYYNSYELQSNAPYYANYYYESSGIINADMSNMPASQPVALQKPGCPIIVDRNGDGTITAADIKMTNEVPKIYFGFGNTIKYKNFDLDIFMYSQLGIDKFNYAWHWASANGLADINTNQNTFTYRVWNSQTNPTGTLPGIAYELANVTLPGGAGISTDFQNASFLRVRNITFGYTFSSKILGSVSKYVSHFRIYVESQNPFTFTKFEGFDPEVDSGTGLGVNESVGGSGLGTPANLPQIRTFTAGINLIF